MTTILFDCDSKMSSWLDWKETIETDKIEYYDRQKHGITEIFIKVRLPHKFYEIANSVSIIYNMKSFDDYVSSLVYQDIERLLDGTEEIGDAILHKFTGEKTEYHSKEESDSKDSTKTDTTELPSKEEVESKWGKIPDDP